MIRRVVSTLIAMAVLMPVASCRVENGNGNPVPGTPHAPVIVPGPGAYRTVYMGVAIRRQSDNANIQGRVEVTITAVDQSGQGGMVFEKLPVHEDRPSGWEYPVSIEVNYKKGVLIKIVGIVTGRSVGERLDCWIRDETRTVYYDQNWHNMDPYHPQIAHDVECKMLLTPAGG